MNKTRIFVFAAIVAVCGSGCNPYPTPTNPNGYAPTADSATDASKCPHEYDKVCYELPVPDKTYVEPLYGHYIVRPADPAVSVEPLDTYGFDVVKDMPYVNFTVDTFAYYKINITYGAFSRIHGAAGDGTYYPSDGFMVSGSFVTPTEAQGFFQMMPMLVKKTPGNFIATHESQIDAGK